MTFGKTKKLERVASNIKTATTLCYGMIYINSLSKKERDKINQDMLTAFETRGKGYGFLMKKEFFND